MDLFNTGGSTDIVVESQQKPVRPFTESALLTDFMADFNPKHKTTDPVVAQDSAREKIKLIDTNERIVSGEPISPSKKDLIETQNIRRKV